MPLHFDNALFFLARYVMGCGAVMLGIHNILQLRKAVRNHCTECERHGSASTDMVYNSERTKVVVKVPATSANMGPGAHCIILFLFSLALSKDLIRSG